MKAEGRRRRAEAALWRAAKAEGPKSEFSVCAGCPVANEHIFISRYVDFLFATLPACG
jgi:hypothetical protein